MTHMEAKVLFAKCRNKENGYRLGNNTRLQKRGGAFAVRYHNTDVVMIRPDGTYRLNSGGWRTKTTKERINHFSPCVLGQTHGMWFVNDTPYSDGILINSDGNPVNKSTYTSDEARRLERRVDRLFSRFHPTDRRGLQAEKKYLWVEIV